MGLLVEFGCGVYIDLCRAHTNVAHIGGECREMGVDILAIAIPFEKAMNGKTMLEWGRLLEWGRW